MTLFSKEEPKKSVTDDPKPQDPPQEKETKAACIVFNIYCGECCKKEK